MNSATIAWWIAGASCLGCAALAYAPLRRYQRLGSLRWFVPALALTLTLVPYRFDEAHLAPAWVVAVFRTFFESGMDPGPPWRLLAAAATGLCAAYIAVLAGRGLVRAVWRKIKGASGAPKRVK